MGVVAAGIIGAAVIGAGASAYAANEQADAQRDATKTNAQNIADTNATNERIFHANRGAQGSALLPEYAKTLTGEQFEPYFFGDARAIYDATQALSPQDQLAAYRFGVDSLAPVQNAAEQTAAGLFDGSLVNEAIGNQQPVADARNQGVAARKSAGLEALQQTLNQIKLIQTGKGYSGDSFGNRLLQFNARRQVNTDAATDQAQTNVQNAQDVANIKQQGIQSRLNNLSLPYTMARQKASLQDLPEDLLLDRTARRQQLFNTFKMGQGQFAYQPLPTVQPVASTGQNVGQSVAALAGSLGNYYANQKIANTLAGNSGNNAPIYREPNAAELAAWNN